MTVTFADETSWRDEASCLGYDPLWWFPAEWTKARPEVFAICAACPVQAECLADALTWPVGVDRAGGIRGGVTVSARQGMPRPARRKPPQPQSVCVVYGCDTLCRGRRGMCGVHYYKHRHRTGAVTTGRIAAHIAIGIAQPADNLQGEGA